MKQTFKVGTIPSTKDKYFEEVKDTLVDLGAVEESVPDSKLADEVKNGIGQSLEALSDVKQALIEKGVASEDTPSSELDEAIKSIEIPETWDNINLESKKKIYTKTYDYVYYHSNGIDAYGSYSSSSKTGIWHWNVITGVEKKIYTSGYYWYYFFEDSKGNVYVGSRNSNSSSNGIIHLNGETATQIYASSFYWHLFFEDSKGNVYVSSSNSNSGNSGSTGIFHLNGETVTRIYTSGYDWQYFFEDSKGNVYVSGSNSSSAGIIYLNGTTATKIYTRGYSWQYFTEKPQGVIATKSSQPDGQEFLLTDFNQNVYLVKE